MSCRGIRCLAVARAVALNSEAAAHHQISSAQALESEEDLSPAGALPSDWGPWQLLGLLTFLDPPRPDTK